MPFKLAVRDCAIQVLSNATYIGNELPDLEVPADRSDPDRGDERHARRTKHDLVTELSELDEFEVDGASDGLMRRSRRIVDWSMAGIDAMQAQHHDAREIAALEALPG